MTRVADRFIHFRLLDKPQLWNTEGWHERFNMPADPQEFGFSWTNEQVNAWQAPPKAVLMEYFDVVNTEVALYYANFFFALFFLFKL